MQCFSGVSRSGVDETLLSKAVATCAASAALPESEQLGCGVVRAGNTPSCNTSCSFLLGGGYMRGHHLANWRSSPEATHVHFREQCLVGVFVMTLWRVLHRKPQPSWAFPWTPSFTLLLCIFVRSNFVRCFVGQISRFACSVLSEWRSCEAASGNTAPPLRIRVFLRTPAAFFLRPGLPRTCLS